MKITIELEKEWVEFLHFLVEEESLNPQNLVEDQEVLANLADALREKLLEAEDPDLEHAPKGFEVL